MWSFFLPFWSGAQVPVGLVVNRKNSYYTTTKAPTRTEYKNFVVTFAER
jgi:hypothetical protein